MNNTIKENNTFERNKNIKAFSYTIVICALLFIIFLLNNLSLPAMPKPIVDEGIEVNLGNSNDGLGNVQPQLIGDPSPTTSTSPAQTETAPPESLDNDGNEVINTPPKVVNTKPNPKPIIATPKITTTPKTPTPKAVFGPQSSTPNGTRSTVSNDYKGFGEGKNKNEISGDPNGGIGKATSGKNGLSIKSGLNGRSIAIQPTFKDEFNENAKVCVDVNVDANGKVLNAVINPRGTTTTNANIRKIAVKKAFEVKFNSGKDEDFGTIVFDFKVTN